jgi:hypothetical protein
MKKNMGTAGRIIRLMAATLLMILYFMEIVTGAWGIVLLVVGTVFLVTSYRGVCPLYSLLGINTCSHKQQKA